MLHKGRDALGKSSNLLKTPKKRPIGRFLGVFATPCGAAISSVKVLKSTQRCKQAILVVACLLVPLSVLFSTFTLTIPKAQAATSSTLNFQARLLSNTGAVVPDGTYNMQFNLYTVASGGSTQWTDTRLVSATQGITIKAGYFSVNLGDTSVGGTAFPSTINWDQEQWLGLTVRGTNSCTPFSSCASPADGEMTPRFKLTAVPYAFQAGNALGVTSNPTSTASTNSGAVTVKTGNATGATSNSGNLTIDVGTATQTTGTITVGSTSASALTLGRSGLTTSNAGALTVAQLLTGNLGLTVTGAAVNLNASSNFATNINTGTSTGAVSIGNSLAGAIALQSASTIGLTGTTTITGLSSGSGRTLTVNNSTSTGIIFEAQDNGTPVLTIADGGVLTGTVTAAGTNIALFNFNANTSATSGINGGLSVTNTVLPLAASSAATRGSNSTIMVPATASVAFTGDLHGFWGIGRWSSTAGATSATGDLSGMVGIIQTTAGTNGSIATANAVKASGQFVGGTPVTTFSGFRATAPSGAGTLPVNAYGVYVENQTAGTSTDYGIYIAGADTYALFIDGGATRLDGTLEVQSLATLSAGLTVSGAAVSLNDSSNFATSINGGTSSGSVTINGGTSTGTTTIGNGASLVSVLGTLQGTDTTGLTFEGTTADAFETTFAVVDPTVGDQIYQLPNAAAAGTYQICTTANNCTGLGSFIQNQNAGDQTANFRISGTGRANTSFTSPLYDSISGTLSVGTSTATGVTLGGTTNTTSLLLQGAAAATYTIGTSNNTGGITVGNSTATNTISIGSAAGASATQTINIGAGTSTTSGGKLVNIATGTPGAGTTNTIAIGNGGAATGTVGVTIGSNGGAAHTTLIQGGNGATAVQLQTATGGGINIGTLNNTQTITVGNLGGATSLNLQAASFITIDGVGATTYNIAGSTTTGTVVIGATLQTGTLTLGRSTATNTISIGSAVTSATNTQTVNIANGAGAGTAINVNILSGLGTAGTGTLTLGNNPRVTQIDLGNSSAAAARTVNIASGNSTGTDTLNIATGNLSGAFNKVVNIANGSPTSSGVNQVTIGSIAAGGNTTTIQGGNGATALRLMTAASGTLSVGDNGVASTIQVGNTTGAVAQTINIGTNATASSTNTVVVGSTVAGAVTLQSATAVNINSPSVVTNATTLGVFNTNAATVTAFQAGTSISIGATTGTLTVRNANQTFGNAAGSGLFTNNGATRNATLAVANLAGGGAIGANTATVDIYTAAAVTQTTASQTLSLPSPTSTTAGRIFFVSNVGSAAFTMHSVSIAAGASQLYIWNGTAWAASSVDGSGAGVTTLAAIGASPNANGATISANTLNLQPASASFGGVVTTGTQTFAGAKTFTGTTDLSATNITTTGGLPFAAQISATASSGAVSLLNGTYSEAFLTGTASTTNYIMGSQNLAYSSSSATAASAVAIGGYVSNNGIGTITAAYGLELSVSNTSTGTITDGYGLEIYAATNSGGGTFTNMSGIAIAEQAAATNNTNLLIGTSTIPAGQFSIYNSSTDQNVFAGNLRVGSTVAPTVALDVTGAALFSSTLGITGILTVGNGTFGQLNLGDGIISKSTGGGFEFDSSLRTADGLVTGPAFSFRLDPDSGMYSGGNDILNFATASTLRLSVTNSGISTTGNLTVGSGAGVGLFTNNGATRNATLAVANLAGGGAIGANTATVDIYTAAAVTQTTASQTLSLPSPTSTTAGRIFFVSNVGSAAFTMHSVSIAAGASQLYIWNGTAWAASSVDGSGAGVTTMAAIGASPNANGATISANTLTLQPASASFGGVVTTGTQTITGSKTFDTQANFTAAGTGLSVTNNATVGGNLTVDTNTLYVDSANNFVGIGTTSGANSILNVASNAGASNGGSIIQASGTLGYATGAAELQYAFRTFSNVTPGSAATGSYFGGIFGPQGTSTTNLTGATIGGVYGLGTYAGASGSLSNAIGGRFTVNNSSTGTITRGYGVQIVDFTNPSGTISNRAGLQVDAFTTASTNSTLVLLGTNTIPAADYAIYNSSTDNNVFAGNLRIGSTTAPTVALDVTGAGIISANLTVDTDTLFVDATNNRVGIGNTGSSGKLSITGATSALLLVDSTGANNSYITVRAPASQQAGIEFVTNGATRYQLGAQTDNSFFLYDNASTRNAITVTTGTLNLQPSAGNVVIGLADATGSLLVLDAKNTAGDPGVTNGGIYYNSNAGRFRCAQAGSWTDCIAGAGTVTLQGAYGNDADGSDTIIALTTADDSLIVRNPAAAGSDSAYILTVDQLATGASNGGLIVASAGGASGFALRVNDDGTLTDSTPFAIDNAGLVLIGTTTPLVAGKPVSIVGTESGATGPLALRNTSSTGYTGIQLYRDTGALGGFFTFGGSALTNEYQDNLNFATAGAFDLSLSTNFVIGAELKNGGDFVVGVHTTTPNGRFTVNNGATAQNILNLQDNGTSVLTVADGGSAFFNSDATTTTQLEVRDATSATVTLLVADSTNDRIYIGDTTADAVGTLLVLDTKNNAGDPTGVAGAMYYNSNAGAFRCFTSSWADCGGVGGGSTLQASYGLDTDGSDTIISLTTADDSLLFTNPASAGSDSEYVLTVEQLSTAATKGGLQVASAGADASYALRINDDGTLTDSSPMVVFNTGAVAIGSTTSGLAKVLVQGTTSEVQFAVRAASGQTTGNFVLFEDNAGVNLFEFTAAGRLGIGKTAATRIFEVAGDIRLGTGTTGCLEDNDGTLLAGACVSDQSLKTNVSDLTGSTGGSILDRFAQLRPVTYNWNTNAQSTFNFGGGSQTGIIAQEVEALFPELISVGDDGYKKVRFNYLDFYAIQAIKELKVVTDTLDTRIDVLEAGQFSGNLSVAGVTQLNGNLSVQGIATVNELVVTGNTNVQNITVNGKIISKGNVPTVALGQTLSAVLGASITNSGTDTAGTVELLSGTQASAGGEIAVLTFDQAYANAPKIVISGNNAKSAKLGAYVVRTATGFKIVTDDPLQLNQTYSFDYIIIEATN